LNIENIEISFIPSKETTATVSAMQVAPNPFSTSTSIRLNVEQEGDVLMRFYDISGRLLIAKSELLPAGVHDFEITKDELNIESGVVICRVTCDGVAIVKRLVVVGN
jgi:hypothetical protein